MNPTSSYTLVLQHHLYWFLDVQTLSFAPMWPSMSWRLAYYRAIFLQIVVPLWRDTRDREMTIKHCIAHLFFHSSVKLLFWQLSWLPRQHLCMCNLAQLWSGWLAGCCELVGGGHGMEKIWYLQTTVFPFYHLWQQACSSGTAFVFPFCRGHSNPYLCKNFQSVQLYLFTSSFLLFLKMPINMYPNCGVV